MPRYSNEHGIQIDVPEELATRLNGLTPVDDPAPPVRRTRRAPKKPDPSE